jgi:hypothetical protein
MRKQNVVGVLIAAALLAFANLTGSAGQLNASIVTLGSDFQDLTNSPPSSVVPGALESDTQIRIFAENSGVTVTSQPGLTNGTLVDSFFIHWDPANNGANNEVDFSNGSVTFSQNILAVYSSDANLNSTDSSFGLAGTTYPVGGQRGTRPNGGEILDAFSFSGSTLTISKLYTENMGIDQLRVITVSAVPEPTSLVMFGLAMVGVARRRRSQR